MIYGIDFWYWVLFFVMNLLVGMASYCISSALTKKQDISVTLISTFLIYFSLITLLILFIGIILKNFSVLAVFVGACILSVPIIAFLWRARIPFTSSIYISFRGLLSEHRSWVLVLLTLLLLQLWISFIKVAVMPVNIADSLSYRAPPAVMWYQLGMIPSVLDVPVNEINGRSLGIAVLMLWYFLPLQDDLLVNLPQFVSSLVLVLVSYAIARQCNVTRTWSLTAAVLIYFMPTVLIQSVVIQDHLSINVAFLCALYFLRDFFIKKNPLSLILLGISVGLMFDFKNNAVIYMPVLFMAAIYLYIKNRDEFRPSGRNIAIYSGIAFFLILVIGGYWTIRNMVVFHDPFGLTFAPMNKVNNVYDIVVERNGTVDNSDISFPNVFRTFLSENNLFSNLKAFFPRVSDMGHNEYMGNMRNVSGFGPQFFIYGLISLGVLLVSIWKKQWRYEGIFYAVTALGLLMLYFAVMDNLFSYRNFMFFSALMIICFFCTFDRPGIFRLPDKYIVMALSLICIIWSMYVNLHPNYANYNTFKEFFSLDRHYQSVGRYAGYFRANPKVFRQLDEFPESEPIAYMNYGARNTWIYANYDVHWKRRAIYIPMTDDLVHCDESNCFPEYKLKQILSEKEIHLINLCVADYCPALKDDDFFTIGRGLYYFDELAWRGRASS